MENVSSQKFFLYARKSTDVEDKQVLSIEAQLQELRDFAKRENIEIVCEFVEKQSAKVPGRPIFNDMIAQIEKGFANGILAWHPDRLARNSVDGGRIIYLVMLNHTKMLETSSSQVSLCRGDILFFHRQYYFLRDDPDAKRE